MSFNPAGAHALLVERMLARKVVDAHGCWLWPGATNVSKDGSQGGYGKIKSSGRTLRVHIVSYEHFIGPVPPGMQVDHACHNDDKSCAGGGGCRHRRCWNPAHLQVRLPEANRVAGRPRGRKSLAYHARQAA